MPLTRQLKSPVPLTLFSTILAPHDGKIIIMNLMNFQLLFQIAQSHASSFESSLIRYPVTTNGLSYQKNLQGVHIAYYWRKNIMKSFKNYKQAQRRNNVCFTYPASLSGIACTWRSTMMLGVCMRTIIVILIEKGSTSTF